MRKSVQDPCCLIKDSDTIATVLLSRTRWKYATLMVFAITTSLAPQSLLKLMLHVAGL